ISKNLIFTFWSFTLVLLSCFISCIPDAVPVNTVLVQIAGLDIASLPFRLFYVPVHPFAAIFADQAIRASAGSTPADVQVCLTIPFHHAVHANLHKHNHKQLLASHWPSLLTPHFQRFRPDWQNRIHLHWHTPLTVFLLSSYR